MYDQNALKTLKKWGITPEAAQSFGLRWQEAGFKFPSGKGCRQRVLLAQPLADGTKVFWAKHDTRPQAVLFGLDQLPESCQRVYVCNGEKSTLVHYSLGLPSVNTFGELNHIEEAVEVLKEFGVIELVVIPDCDRTGLRAALKWQQSAQAAGLTCHLLDLRLGFAQQGVTPEAYSAWDTRDLWLRLEQDPEAYHAALASLPALEFPRYADELPPAPVKQSRPQRAHPVTSLSAPDGEGQINFAALYERWQAAVLSALEHISPAPARGKHRHCPNPNHADKHPSFRITEQGAPVCTCGSISWDRLAGWVGVPNWEVYKGDYLAQQPRHATRQDRVRSALEPAPTDQDVIRLSERFITNTALDLSVPGCYAIKSPIGTGKTELYARSIQAGEHVLVVSHRISLAAALNRRMNQQHDLGFDYYRDFSGPATREYLRCAPRLVISYNSLHKLLDQEGKLPAHYDKLILDECEQGLEHLTGGTFARAEGVAALAILSQLVKTIPIVIAADAGLSRLSSDWLGDLRPDIRRLWNTYRMKRGHMDIYSEKAPLYVRLQADLERADLPILIATDSKTEAKTLHQFLGDKGFQGICLHAENKDNPENRSFLADLDTNLSQVDYLIHSPTIDAGIDIQTSVKCVYGIFTNHSVTPPIQLQMLGRARQAQHFVVFSAAVGERTEINPQKIKAQYIRNLAHNHRTLGLALEWDEQGNTVLDDKRNAYLNLVVKVEGKRAALLNHAHETFKQLATDEYEVTEIEASEEPDADESTVSALVKEARQARQRLDMEQVLKAEPVGEAEFRRLAMDGQATELVNAGHFRFRVENFYKQDISEDLYKEATQRSYGGMKRLDLFILAHKPSEVLRMRDLEQRQGETWTADHQRQNYSTKLPALKAALSAVFGEQLHMRRFSKKDFALRLIAFEQEYKRLELGRLFNRRRRTTNTDPHKERLKLLRWALAQVGLRLKLWRGRNGKQEYGLDAKRYQEVRELANIRLAGLEDEQRLESGMLLRVLAVDPITKQMAKRVTYPASVLRERLKGLKPGECLHLWSAGPPT